MFLLVLTLFVCSLVGQQHEEPVELNNRGARQQVNGESTAAELSYLQALSAAQAAHAPAETLARVHCNLASLYKSQRRFPAAIRHYQACSNYRRDAPVRQRALILNNLAETMHAAGDANSRQRFREALRLLRNEPGDHDLDRAVLLQNLGVSQAEAGRFREAIELLRESLALKTRLFDASHPQVLLTKDNLTRIERSVRTVRMKPAAVRDTVDVLELVRP